MKLGNKPNKNSIVHLERLSNIIKDFSYGLFNNFFDKVNT